MARSFALLGENLGMRLAMESAMMAAIFATMSSNKQTLMVSTKIILRGRH